MPTLLKGRPRQRQDLCWQQRQARPAELWLVIVDASASTRRHQALAQTKGLLAALFDQAYRQRARLALLTASGRSPQWQRHGLKASAALQPWLQALGAGGGTPLIAALEQARHWLQDRQRANLRKKRYAALCSPTVACNTGIPCSRCRAPLCWWTWNWRRCAAVRSAWRSNFRRITSTCNSSGWWIEKAPVRHYAAQGKSCQNSNRSAVQVRGDARTWFAGRYYFGIDHGCRS